MYLGTIEDEEEDDDPWWTDLAGDENPALDTDGDETDGPTYVTNQIIVTLYIVNILFRDHKRWPLWL